MIDWGKPLEFVDGGDAYVVGRLSASGSCIWAYTGEQVYAETYAELHEQGVRFFVASDPKAKAGGCVNEHGFPARPYNSDFYATGAAVRNRDLSISAASQEAMAASDMWGMF
jgi:hypothetical protein